MENLALFLLITFLVASFGNADGGSSRERPKCVELHGSEKLRGSDFDEKLRSECVESLEMFKDSSKKGEMNLRQVKDVLEEAMGFGCDEGTKESDPWAEVERELHQYCAIGKMRCMPKTVHFRSWRNDVSYKPCCHTHESSNKRNDRNLQILDDMLNEMLGLPCDGGKDEIAKRPAMYCGFAKLRRIRQKKGRHCKGPDVPRKRVCRPLPRLYKPSDMDLQQLNQVLDGIMGFPLKDRKEREGKTNEMYKALLRYCGIGKLHRMPDSSHKNCKENGAFNKTSCGGKKDHQCPQDLNLEEVNDLMEEVMEFAGQKERKGVKTEDLQDWICGYCAMSKFTPVSMNSRPHRKTIDASQKTTCNPLESTERPKKMLLHKINVYLDDLLGYDCKDDKEEEIPTDEGKRVQVEYCGFGKVRFLPENYFLNHKACNTSKPNSCRTQRSMVDPMDLSLSQVSDLLEQMMGIPKGGKITAMGEGLFLFCGITKHEVLHVPLDVHKSSSHFSGGDILSFLPIV